MRKDVLRLVTKTYVDYLRSRMSPAGKPSTHDLEARCLILIDALSDGPTLPDHDRLDVAGVALALEWMLKSLSSAHTGDSWAQLSLHLLQVNMPVAAVEVHALITKSPKKAPLHP